MQEIEAESGLEDVSARTKTLGGRSKCFGSVNQNGPVGVFDGDDIVLLIS